MNTKTILMMRIKKTFHLLRPRSEGIIMMMVMIMMAKMRTKKEYADDDDEETAQPPQGRAVGG